MYNGNGFDNGQSNNLNLEKELNKFEKTGLRITIDNDKFSKQNDNNNNNINAINLNKNNRCNSTLIPNQFQCFVQNNNIHSRVQTKQSVIEEPNLWFTQPIAMNHMEPIPISRGGQINTNKINDQNNRNSNNSQFVHANNIVINCKNKFNKNNPNDRKNQSNERTGKRFDKNINWNNKNRNNIKDDFNNTQVNSLPLLSASSNHTNTVATAILTNMNRLNSIQTKSENWDDENDSFNQNKGNNSNLQNKNYSHNFKDNDIRTPIKPVDNLMKNPSSTPKEKCLIENNIKKSCLPSLLDIVFWDDDEDCSLKKQTESNIVTQKTILINHSQSVTPSRSSLKRPNDLTYEIRNNGTPIANNDNCRSVIDKNNNKFYCNDKKDPILEFNESNKSNILRKVVEKCISSEQIISICEATSLNTTISTNYSDSELEKQNKQSCSHYVETKSEPNIKYLPDDELHVRISTADNCKANLPIMNKTNQIDISPTPSVYSSTSSSTFLTSSNNLIIDEDAQSNNLHDLSPTTGNYGSLIELKENLFERKYNYKSFELKIMKLKQKKMNQFETSKEDLQQQDQAYTQFDHQKHDYYEINRKLQEHLRKQKLFFNKAANLLNNELKIQIQNHDSKSSQIENNNNNLDYFCKQCDLGFEELNYYLNHLYTSEHQKFTGILTAAAAQTVNLHGNNVFLDELKTVEKGPLKGEIVLFNVFQK